MNFITLQNRVLQYVLDRVPETDALVPEWINQAVRDAEQRHNFLHMEAILVGATAAGVRDVAAVPALWKETRALPWIQAQDGTVQEIEWASGVSDLHRYYNNSPTTSVGAPQQLIRNGSDIDVYPYSDGYSDWPGGQYVVYVPYWAFSADAVAETDENTIMAARPFYVIYRATFYALMFNRDEERAAQYGQMAESEFQLYQNLDKRGRLPGRINLSVQRGVFAPGNIPRFPIGASR